MIRESEIPMFIVSIVLIILLAVVWHANTRRVRKELDEIEARAHDAMGDAELEDVCVTLDLAVARDGWYDRFRPRVIKIRKYIRERLSYAKH